MSVTRDGDGPRVGDRVRWTRLRPYVVEGVLEEVRHDAYCIRNDEGRLRACQTEDVTVEVLERADDPSKNLVGTVRREQHPEDETGQGYSVWQHVEFQQSATKTGSHWVCTHSTHHGNLGESLTHDQVRGMPVIGAAPGTPAAEAQTPIPEWEMEPGPRPSVRVANEPHGLPIEARLRIAEHLAAGRLDKAYDVAEKWGAADAKAYVQDMSDYQSYLSEHAEGGEDELPDWEKQLMHEQFVKDRIGAALHQLNPVCGGPTDLYIRIERARDALREALS